MSKSVRHCLGQVPGILLGGAIALGTAVEVGAAGEILVLDGNRGALTEDSRGSLFVVDPASGERALVSDFGNPIQGPLRFSPTGLAQESAGTVLVVDVGRGGSEAGLFRVDLGSGVRTLVSDFRDASQGALVSTPVALALEPGGTVLVADEGEGKDPQEARSSGWTSGAAGAPWSPISRMPPGAGGWLPRRGRCGGERYDPGGG